MKEFYTPYDKLPFPMQWGKDSRPMHPALEFNRHQMCLEGLTDDEVRKAVAVYYGMVTYLDQYHNVGSNHGIFMIRKNRYKLVYYVSYQPQLFDLEKDPDELTDLAVLPEYQTVLVELESELRKVCDPEEMDRICLSDQLALLEAEGGREVILKRGSISYSPVPKGDEKDG